MVEIKLSISEIRKKHCVYQVAGAGQTNKLEPMMLRNLSVTEQFESPGFLIQREFNFVFCFENCHNFNYKKHELEVSLMRLVINKLKESPAWCVGGR